jgi:hypothetical protein
MQMANIAPNPFFGERASQNFSRQQAPEIPGNKGPLRFEEGIGTDTDVPNDFARGAYADTTFGARLNQNVPTTRKLPEETMRERAHLGSASWVDAPRMLGDFMQGAGAGQTPPQFERVQNPLTTGYYRRAATVVTD